MTRETLGEIALNRQDNEKEVSFFTPESEDISDGEESVHPALKDAASIVCEGQEAMWVEDDVNEIFKRASSKDKSMSKRKNKFNLFRRKATQKAVVLLPPQPVDSEDVENQEIQLAPESATDAVEKFQTIETESQEKLVHEEEEVYESNSGTDEPQFEADYEASEQEKEDDIEDVVHGSIDIPDEILEEMKLNVEDAVERARKDLDSESSDSKSQLSSLGLTVHSLDSEEEYGVEMNIPSSGKAVEIVGTGPMILEAETIKRPDEAEKVKEGKKGKWGLLRIFKGKSKQQKVPPPSSRDDNQTGKHETAEDEVRPEVCKPQEASPEHLDSSSNHEPDRYSVGAPKAALADDMDDSDASSDDEDDVLDSGYYMEEDEEDDVDDRYRIGPPKMSKSEIHVDTSTVFMEQETIPNRAEDRPPTVLLQIDIQEENEVESKVEPLVEIRAEDRPLAFSLHTDLPETNEVESQVGEPSAENVDEPQLFDEAEYLESEEVDDETNDVAEQEENIDMSSVQRTTKDEKTEKRKSRFVGIFGRRKVNKKPTKSRDRKVPKAEESPSAEPEGDEVPKCQPEDTSKIPEELLTHPVPSPIASIKGDSMTVIADAVSKGARMAVESNLETEGTLKSRRIRTRADSSKDVIDLIKERTQNNSSKRQDPLDSSETEIRMSVSKDPSGKAMFEPARERKEANSLMHLAPTPRAKKTVEKVEEEQEEPSRISHQQKITQRLYGTTTANGHLLATKKVYIGDLLQGVSTDPTVDTTASEEKETNQVIVSN